MKLVLIKFLAVIIIPSISMFMLKTDVNKNDKKDKKITICHIPPGNPDNMHKITISYSALQTHLDHGDLICGSDQ